MNEEELITTIKTLAYAGIEPEVMAERFGLETETIIVIIGEEDTEYTDKYTDREFRCGTCGSPLDGDGVPSDCTGDCDQDDDQYYCVERGDGDPRELEF